MSISALTPSGGTALPPSSDASAAPAAVRSHVERFSLPPAVVPEAHFQLFGKQFICFVTGTHVQLGRSKQPIGSQIDPTTLSSSATSAAHIAAGGGGAAVAASPSSSGVSAPGTAAAASTPSLLLSLGNDHMISRAHLTLRWVANKRRWEAAALGKNGFWMGNTKYLPAEGSSTSGSSSSASVALPVGYKSSTEPCALPGDRATLLRIGGASADVATMFYFVPALAPPTASPGASTTGATAGATAAAGAHGKKRRKSEGVTASSESGHSGAPVAPASEKAPTKRKKMTETTGATPALPPPLSSARVDSDDLLPLSALLAR